MVQSLTSAKSKFLSLVKMQFKVLLLSFFCILLVACVGENENTNNDTKSEPDKWWERTDKYEFCYGKITAAHKANGLHKRNRLKSIEVKKALCKIAATSKTGEGSYWLK